MPPENDQARTQGAVAAVLSAFVVFVVGGGVVLKVWADQRMAALASFSAPHAASAVLKEPAAQPAAASEKVAESDPAPQTRPPSKREVVREPKRSPRVQKVSSPDLKEARESASARVASPPPATPPRSVVKGTGRVIIREVGDARVFLLGEKGMFKSGDVPAGSYSIQASFGGGDPRMAGTVQVADKQRVVIICRSADQRCQQK